MLFRDAQVLRRVDRQPEPLVPVRTQRSFGGELRERARLVIAPLGEPGERLLAEDVDTAADPLVEARCLAEPGDEVAVEVDDSERRAERDDGDRCRGAAGLL